MDKDKTIRKMRGKKPAKKKRHARIVSSGVKPKPSQFVDFQDYLKALAEFQGVKVVTY